MSKTDSERLRETSKWIDSGYSIWSQNPPEVVERQRKMIADLYRIADDLDRKSRFIRWITPDIARKLLIVRDALVSKNYENAWHWLYSIASPGFDALNPWDKLEKIAGTLVCSACQCEVPAYFIEPDDTRCYLCNLPEPLRRTITIQSERDHYKALMEYWKKRCEASEKESFLYSKSSAYPAKENMQAWKDALSKLDEIKLAEPGIDGIKK